MGENAERIKILLADDHRMFIDGVRSVLNLHPQFEVVAECTTGQQAVEYIRKATVHVAVMDVNMPVMDGIEATKIMKELEPRLKIVVVTMHHELSVIQRLLRAGADTYLLKNTGADELVMALEKTWKGESYTSPAIAQSMTEALRLQKKNEQTSTTLTPRESQVLRLIADGLTNAEIADEVSLSVNTIDTHRKNLLAKLGLRNTAQLIRYAVEKGLLR